MDYHRVADCLDQAYPYASNSSSTSSLYVSMTFFLSLPILTVRRRRRKDFSRERTIERSFDGDVPLICDSYQKFINIHLPLNIIIDHPRVLNRSISTIRSDKCAERRTMTTTRREMKDFLLGDWPEDIHLLSVRRRRRWFWHRINSSRHVILSSSSSSSSSRWWWRKGANASKSVSLHTHTHLSCGKRNILH